MSRNPIALPGPVIFDFDQNSPEWVAARLAIPTASEFKSILAKGEGKMRRAYMMRLLGERFTGEPADTFSNSHMERGKVMEHEARRLYEFTHDAELRQVGFIRNGAVGASPDSLIGYDGILEIKTALPHIQLERIFAEVMPPEHKAQVHGLLWIAEREWCDFVSYWPKLPPFEKRVYRDEKYIKELAAGIADFLDEMEVLSAMLIRSGATRMIGANSEIIGDPNE